MKATRAQVEERVSLVLQMRVAGAETSDIVRYAAENGWNVKRRQVEEYIARSDDIMRAEHEADRRKLLVRHCRQRRLIAAKALETGDWRGCLAALKDEAGLQRLYDADPPPPSDTPPPESPKAVAALLAGLLAEVLSGKRDGETATKVTPLVNSLLAAMSAGDLE